MLRFRVRRSGKRVGPWWPSIEDAEQAAIDLGLARRDDHYDMLHLEPEVVIDCSEAVEDG